MVAAGINIDLVAHEFDRIPDGANIIRIIGPDVLAGIAGTIRGTPACFGEGEVVDVACGLCV